MAAMRVGGEAWVVHGKAHHCYHGPKITLEERKHEG